MNIFCTDQGSPLLLVKLEVWQNSIPTKLFGRYNLSGVIIQVTIRIKIGISKSSNAKLTPSQIGKLTPQHTLQILYEIKPPYQPAFTLMCLTEIRPNDEKVGDEYRHIKSERIY